MCHYSVGWVQATAFGYEKKGCLQKWMEDLGCTNDYIKHDTTELYLYYTLFSHCNIHIDHM